MRPTRAIAAAIFAATLVLAGCATDRGGSATATTAPPGTAPTTVAPTTTAPPRPTTGPPSTAQAVTTALAFMRREVGMLDPVAGPFRWTGARTGRIDVRARIPGDANPQRGPVTVVSLQRLAKVWYVLGTRTTSIRVVSPRAGDPIRTPAGVMADVTGGERVRVRVTQDRYGTDVQLGSGYLTPREESTYLDGQVAFRRPSGATGSIVVTRASGHNGEVVCATVVRVRFATGQPPTILRVRTSPPLAEQDGWRRLPDATVTFRVTATRADRARLLFTGTGTEMAWNAQVVAEDASAANGLRLTWHPDRGVLGHLRVEVLGPGGITGQDLGGVHSE
jgi:hypothetical protein